MSIKSLRVRGHKNLGTSPCTPSCHVSRSIHDFEFQPDCVDLSKECVDTLSQTGRIGSLGRVTSVDTTSGTRGDGWRAYTNARITTDRTGVNLSP
ncbi:hypothetical protein Taro_009540 [Colocasia esculenta]|uniref:Uncharacterized protein n=1 Tax=Colocasia esculenta TaxID=4460 RepID=A0A843UA81_COLES|nr:hypothetical protein [Colocasia esculenta]